jgi:hypothetical protein
MGMGTIRRGLSLATPAAVKLLIQATAERDGSLKGDPRVLNEGPQRSGLLVSCALNSYHNYGRIGYGENWSSQSGSGVDGYRA